MLFHKLVYVPTPANGADICHNYLIMPKTGLPELLAIKKKKTILLKNTSTFPKQSSTTCSRVVIKLQLKVC